MICPECRQYLTTYNIQNAIGKKITIEKCPSCFGFWLDRWEANDLSKKDVENLTRKDAKTNFSILSSFARKCPHCQIPLARIQDKDFPSAVAIFTCPQCQGSWFPHGQLLELKKSQQGKGLGKTITHLPLKSISNFAFPLIIVLLIGLSIPMGLKLASSPKETRTQAEEKIQKIHVIPLPTNAVIISFKSPSLSTSELQYGPASDNLSLKAFQTAPSFYQQVKLVDLQPNTIYYYQIILKEDSGKITTSEILSFTTQGNAQKRNLLQ